MEYDYVICLQLSRWNKNAFKKILLKNSKNIINYSFSAKWEFGKKGSPLGKDIKQAKRDIKEKFKEIMRRPIDDGYEENMKIMHDDEHKFLEYLESNKYVDVQEALKHKNDLFK